MKEDPVEENPIVDYVRVLLFILGLLIQVSPTWGSDRVDGEFLVSFRSTASEEDRRQLRIQLGAQRLNLRVPLTPEVELWKFSENVNSYERLSLLSENGLVDWASPHFQREAGPLSWRSSGRQTETLFSLPFDDPFVSEQWGLVGPSGMRLDRVWGSIPVYRPVIVAIMDTGVDLEHEDIKGRVWVNSGEIPFNDIDDDQNGYVDDVHGWNYLDDDYDVSDSDGHGTHVASLIGAVPNNGKGIVGVHPNVQLMILKVVPNSGAERDRHIMEALSYASNHGAKIINCSFGKYRSSRAVGRMIDEVGRRGALVVAAAGNEKLNTDRRPMYPAGFPSSAILSVAASDDSERATDWSNFGSQSVDVHAPGEYVYGAVLNHHYEPWSGTSMASPYVAGLAALFVSSHQAEMTPEELKHELMMATRKRQGLRRKSVTSGVMDAEILFREWIRNQTESPDGDLSFQDTGTNGGRSFWNTLLP